MIFFMGGPQLGELEAGLVASLFASAVVGVTVSVVSGGIATVAITAAIAAAAPMIRRYDFQQSIAPRRPSPSLLDDPLPSATIRP